MSEADKIIFMDRGNYTTCTVHLQGGTISSYRVRNKEMLYMKQKTAIHTFAAIRGGIQFTFPYFGVRVNGPKHGFARHVPWTLEEGPTVKEDGNVETVLSLKENAYTKSIWNFEFKITTIYTLCVNELRIAVKVENTSNYFPFRFTILRYSIFKVQDVTKCEIYGLAASKYLSLENSSKTLINPDPETEKVTIRGQTLKLYLETPSEIEVRNIDDKGFKLKVRSIDLASRDVLIYNHWHDDINGVKSSHDENEYLFCLGVGSGHLHSDIKLWPKQCWESRYVIEVINEEDDKRIQKLGELLDNPLTLFQQACMRTDTYYDESCK